MRPSSTGFVSVLTNRAFPAVRPETRNPPSGFYTPVPAKLVTKLHVPQQARTLQTSITVRSPRTEVFPYGYEP
jgi:hypothetical protein